MGDDLAGVLLLARQIFVGQIAVRDWLGEPADRKMQVGGVGWVRAVDWITYQRRTFVTPAFPAFISGHSTFSRAGMSPRCRWVVVMVPLAT